MIMLLLSHPASFPVCGEAPHSQQRGELQTMKFDISRFPLIPNRHRMRIAMASLGEWIRGLDFTLPDRLYDRNRNDGAMYYASPASVLQQIFSQIDISRFPRFIDIGCGKGYVLWQAKKYGFSQVGGVEYDDKLCQICRKNMKRLKLDIDPVCADAREFQNYGDYDVFYFFNPFVDEVMRQVIDQILRQCRGREIMLVYYRPRYTDYIETCGYFTRVAKLFDPVNKYDIHIYQGKLPS